MNMISHNYPRLIGLAVASVLAIGANSGALASNAYKFESAGCLSGDTMKVRLIDASTGQAVRDAQVFAVHRQWLPTKGAPRFIDRKVALSPDGQGRFVYEGQDVAPGATIAFVARLDGQDVSGNASVC